MKNWSEIIKEKNELIKILKASNDERQKIIDYLVSDNVIRDTVVAGLKERIQELEDDYFELSMS